MQTRRTTPSAASICGIATMMSVVSVFAKDAAPSRRSRRAGRRTSALRSRRCDARRDRARQAARRRPRVLPFQRRAARTKSAFIESLSSGKRDYVSIEPTVEIAPHLRRRRPSSAAHAKITVARQRTDLETWTSATPTSGCGRTGRWQMTAWRSLALPAGSGQVVSQAAVKTRLVAALLAALLTAPLCATAPQRDEASARAALLARFDAALHARREAALDKLLADDLEYCGVPSATCSDQGPVPRLGRSPARASSRSLDAQRLERVQAVRRHRGGRPARCATVTALRDGAETHHSYLLVSSCSPGATAAGR